MFGYIIINKGDMKFREFDIYHSYYCGLCQALKERYGKLGQISLSYDITFLCCLAVYMSRKQKFQRQSALHILLRNILLEKMNFLIMGQI